MLTYPSVSQRFAITALLSGLPPPRSAMFSSLHSAYSQPFGSDCTLHPQVCHISVLQSTDPLPVEDVFGSLRINGQHWLHLVTQILEQRHNSF